MGNFLPEGSYMTSYLLKAEFAKLIASYEELEKAHQNANSDLEDTYEDLQVKNRTIEELFKKNHELEAENKMLSVNHKNLERNAMKVATENKDLKKEVTIVKSELKMSIRVQSGLEHNLNKKIEALEFKVKSLLENKAARAAEEKSVKKKVKALEKKEAELEVSKMKIERKTKLRQFASLDKGCQTNAHPDLPPKITEPLPPIFSSQFCYKTPMIKILSRSLPKINQICWSQQDEDPYLDGAEEYLSWQHDQDIKQFYLDARQLALDKRLASNISNNNNIMMN
jgi:hypothetical protein